MAANVGAIYYTVEADTAKLLTATTDGEASLDRLDKQFKRTDKAANESKFQMTKTAEAVRSLGRESESARGSIGGLGKVLTGLLTIQGVRGLIDMAESYGEMSERVKMATASAAEYDMVQQRLLANANSTYRTLGESSEVYIRTADSLRAMGYSTEGALDAVDSLSYLFVTNATSAQRADGAISAFTKALNKGKVEADGWETLMAAVPSIVNDVAAASGKSAEEIRKLGVSGNVTAQMITEGLVKSLEKNRDAAANMATNLKDAFRAFSNNLSVFLGEANNASGATGVLSSAIIKLGENIETIVKLLASAGAGVMAAYVARIGMAAIANAKAAVETLRHAQAQLQAAKASAAAATAATASAAATTAQAGASNAGAAAAAREATALGALAAAKRTATAAGAALLGVLGGPVGIIALVASAAAGFVLFGNNARGAVPGVNELTNAIDELGEAQLKLRQQQAAEALEKTQRRITELSGEVRMLEKDFGVLSASPGVDDEGLENVRKTIVETRAELEATEARATGLTQALQKIGQEMDRRSSGGGKPAAAPPAADRGGDPETAKRLQAMREELELSKLQGVARAKLAAVQRLGANASAEERAEAERLAEATYRNSEAQKSVASSTKTAVEAAKKDREVLAGMAQDLQLAALSGEALAVAKAKSQLSSFATPQQIADLERMAKALFAIDQQNQKRQKFGATPEDADQYIMGNPSPLSGGAFDDQVARYEAEAEAEQKRYAEQQQRLADARALKIETSKTYDQMEEDAARQHADRMLQIEEAKNSVMMKSGEDAFAALADSMREAHGEQSGIYKAMFATSKAFAIADAMLTLQTALSNAWKLPWPANIPALAMAAASMGSVISGIQSVGMTMGGGRQYGGGVEPSKMYRVNENGQPEVYNAANGRQYLLPNSRGEVVSNKDATGKGDSRSINLSVQLIENPSRAGQVEQQRLSDQDYIVRVVVADIMGEGDISKAGGQVFGWQRRGR